MTPQEAYNQLAHYTIAMQDHDFIHQYIVDAFACQYANKNTKPITLAFGLMGLYLTLEKGFTGKMVQREHVNMANKNIDKNWPKFDIHERKFAMDVFEVLETQPGEARNNAIKDWCRAIWEGYKDCQPKIREWVKVELGI